MNVKQPDPIPTPWEEVELQQAHKHRVRILSECVVPGEFSEELNKELSHALEMETKLTEYEALYNESLLKLKKLFVNH